MLAIDLTNKVAIVTGVSSGIGAGVAKVLAEAGCHVAGCARAVEDEDSVKAFRESVEAFGRKAFYQSVDVTSKEQLAGFVENVAQEFKQIDLVVSNAGVNVFKGASDCTEEEWLYNHELNLASHWRLAKASRKHLEKSASGTFIVMTSNHAYSSIPGCFPYNVTKTALTGLVRAMAIEWGPSVRVLGLAPGFIDTPGNDKWFNSFPDAAAERQRTIDLHPAGKLGTPEEVGSWCAFLASSFAAFATGTTYLLDGGRSALMQDS
ncbi:SDR family NAD(P)-dependent oxidoreductase [Sunxiuqinia sp. sy24]|uniref:SDR family NAD(P)-dependent oxidoreductase n=1 Tax=Sunxiuqinia sp. sy24 TaxID=3461495 RepID=UPI0040464D09